MSTERKIYIGEVLFAPGWESVAALPRLDARAYDIVYVVAHTLERQGAALDSLIALREGLKPGGTLIFAFIDFVDAARAVVSVEDELKLADVLWESKSCWTEQAAAVYLQAAGYVNIRKVDTRMFSDISTWTVAGKPVGKLVLASLK